SPADGAYPVGALAELNGDLYGTTEFGGTDQCSGGCGIVFKISKTGTETVLHTFNGNNGDGYHTLNGLNVINGRLYGTTGLGGPAN
ncbi:choice-of-anchor tandem repeat GloVer-containing protein, partial [Klebsiella pneumoniae]